MALNAKLKRDGGSKRPTEERHDDSECRIEDMSLNAELKKLITLNTKDEALNVKLKHNSKCQTKTNNGSERQNEDAVLNAELKKIRSI